MSLGRITSSRRALVALVAAGVAVYALALWFFIVSPKRAEASRLQTELAGAEQLAQQPTTPTGSPRSPRTRVSDLFRLSEAMPSSGDQASLLLALDTLAKRANVTTAAVTVQDATLLTGGTTAVPVSVTVSGTFGQITRYLSEMRRQVGLKHGRPRVVGRLFTVQSVDITESKSDGFPYLDAAILLNAHAYDGPVVPPAPVTPPETTDTSQGAPTAAGATP